MKRHLQRAEQQKSSSNVTKYCACHEKWLSWLIHEMPFALCGATGLTLQSHQILRVPRKLTLQISEKISENRWNVICNVRPIRAWSQTENDPSMNPSVCNPPRHQGYFSRSARAFCIENCDTFALQLSFQISPSTAPATNRDSWTSPNSAPATNSHTWTSPNSAHATNSGTWTTPHHAPATKSDTWTSLDDSLITWLFYHLILYYYLTFIAWLYYYLAPPLLDSTITRLYYNLLDLLLDPTLSWLCDVVRISEVSQPKLPLINQYAGTVPATSQFL